MGHFGSLPGWELKIALGSLLGIILAYFLAGNGKLLWDTSWGPFWLNSWLGARNCCGKPPGDYFGLLPGWELKIVLGSLLGTILAHFLAGNRKLLWETSWGPFWFNSWLGAGNCFGKTHGGQFGSLPGWEPEIALGGLLGTILVHFLAVRLKPWGTSKNTQGIAKPRPKGTREI